MPLDLLASLLKRLHAAAPRSPRSAPSSSSRAMVAATIAASPERSICPIRQVAFAKLLRRRDDETGGRDEHPDDDPYPEALRAALVADLWPLVRDLQASKAVAEQEGIEADLMRQMRVTSMLPSLREAMRNALEDAPARKAD